jgi:hypothetical protein
MSTSNNKLSHDQIRQVIDRYRLRLLKITDKVLEGGDPVQMTEWHNTVLGMCEELDAYEECCNINQ